MAPRTDAKFLQQLCDKIPSEQMQRDLPIFFREAPKDPWKTLGTWMNGGMEKIMTDETWCVFFDEESF